jgi:glycosyltransferase involved in cell wall biosynthesis
MEMGGESSLPFYYAKLFSRRGVEVSLACHDRVETEIRAAFPELGSRVRIVRDTPVQKSLFRYCRVLPYRVRDLLIGQAIHFSTQIRIRKIAIELARTNKIDVVFEPAPITPKGLSFMYDIGVPVVIGPLCGGMNFPPAFIDLDSRVTRGLMIASRKFSRVANRLVPGKLKAEVLLVANESTAKALPSGYCGRVVRLFESGVDLNVWKHTERDLAKPDKFMHFVYSGRFIDWKGLQFLVPAFAKAVSQEPRCRLDLIGGGELEGEVRAMIEKYGLSERIRLHGWMSRAEAARVVREADVFVMPSLRECGGSALLEAMALGKPVITTNWGGPADYVDMTCGVLVNPSSKSAFVDGLAEAMVRLVRSPELCKSLGEGGRRRVRLDNLDWDSKADRVFSILAEVAGHKRVTTR